MSLEDLKKRLSGELPEVGETIVVHEQSSFRVSVAELKEAIATHPDHPVGKVYAKAVRHLKDDAFVVVDRADVEGLIDNREVQTIVDRSEEGVETRRKEVAVAAKNAPPPDDSKKEAAKNATPSRK